MQKIVMFYINLHKILKWVFTFLIKWHIITSWMYFACRLITFYKSEGITDRKYSFPEFNQNLI